MHRFLLPLLLCFSTGTAQADLYEARLADGTISYSDHADTSAIRSNVAITNPLEAEQLPGIWLAETSAHGKTELTLRNDGSFVFNQFGDNDRTYMCGSWNGDVTGLNLTVKARKRQTEDGQIEQADRSYTDAATILSAQRDRIIVEINGQELVFNRSG